MTLWPCSNPDCAQPCTALALDKRGLCPSCSFEGLLDDLAERRRQRLETFYPAPVPEHPAAGAPRPSEAAIYAFALSLGLGALLCYCLLLTWSFQ